MYNHFGELTLYQTIGEYLEYLELEKGLAQNTIDAYRRDLENFCDTYNIEDISSVDRSVVNSFVRMLKESKYAPTSIIRKVASLRGFFKWASAIGIININPTATLEQPKIPQKLPKVVSIREIEDMLHNNLTPLQHVIMELLYSCGLRVSELVNLKERFKRKNYTNRRNCKFNRKRIFTSKRINY